MDNLQIFISGKGLFLGNEFLLEKMEEIKDLHKRTHYFKNQGYNNLEILAKIFGGEGFTGDITQGELSRMNLINSLLKWE